MIHALLRRYANGYYRLCNHRSHRLGVPCLRFLAYDGQCRHHNSTCWSRCET